MQLAVERSNVEREGDVRWYLIGDINIHGYLDYIIFVDVGIWR